MAGFYADVPGQRMALDVDGSILLAAELAVGVFTVGMSPRTEWDVPTQTEKDNVNNEDRLDDWALAGNDFLTCMIFPEKRDVDGVFFGSPSVTQGGSDYSTDTTNGVDGSWTTLAYVPASWNDDQQYRTGINAQSLTGVRSVRWFNGATSQDVAAIHVYGLISSGETPDRILFLDEDTGLEFGTGGSTPDIMDFGDRPRGSIIDHEFRVRNNSTVAGNNLTATTIVLTREAQHGDMDMWMTYDLDGGGFMTSETVTSLAPETNSALLTMRLDVDDAAVLFVWAARTRVAVTTWA